MKKERPALPYYDEPPTKVEILVSLVSKTAKSESVGSVHPISVRLPTIPFATIQAVAQHSGMSMNKVIVALLDVGLDELWQGLDQEECNQISALRSSFLGDVLQGDDQPGQAAEGDI